jgi:hypothetical protein
VGISIIAANQTISRQFAPGWHNIFNFNTPFANEDAKELMIFEFFEHVQRAEDEIVDLLNKSVLLGEYSNTRVFKEQLEKLSISIANIEALDDYLDDEFLSLSQEVIREGVQKNLEVIVSSYWNFVSKIENKYAPPSKVLIDAYIDPIQDRLHSSQMLPMESERNLRFFYANLFVADCDHFMTYEGKKYLELSALIEKLANDLRYANRYQLALTMKCKFLVGKALLRIQLEGDSKSKGRLTGESSTSVIVQKQNVRSIFNYTDFDTNSVFKNEFDYLNAHYELKPDWEEAVLDSYEAIKHQRFEEMTLRDLHVCIKYFKDCSPDQDELENISDEINQRYLITSRSGPNSQLSYALALSYNYSLNNEFSLLCDLNTTTIEQAEFKYQRLLSSQRITGINNFFPQTKFMEFLLSRIREYFSHEKLLDNSEECDKLIQICRKIEPSYKKNVDWSKGHLNYVFQLSDDLCFYKTGIVDCEKIYISSSFLLPIPRDEKVDKFEKYLAELKVLETSAIVFKSSKKQFERIEEYAKEIEFLKDETKAREHRTIEIVSIFTAIVSFVAGSISLMNSVKSIGQALIFMFALASAFCLFVLVLLSFTRTSRSSIWKSPSPWAVLVFLSISWSILGFNVPNSWFNSTQQTESNENKKSSSELNGKNGPLPSDSATVAVQNK